jgi:hypothetical protein
MDTEAWLKQKVLGKLDANIEARQYLRGYDNAPLGLDFTQPGATPEFKAAVSKAIDEWRAAHPGIDVSIPWAP